MAAAGAELDQDEASGPVPMPGSRGFRTLAALRPVLLALLLFAVGMAVATLPHYDPRGPLVPVGLQAVLAIGAAGVALLWIAGPKFRTWGADLTAAAASAFPAVVLAVALHGSQFAVGGLGISQANRTPAVARYIETWQLVDYSYHGLPAFYPPLMPWLVGRASALVDATPWHALKLASIGMLFLAPLLSYLLWRRLLPARIAALVPVAIVALVSITPSAIRQPDSLLAVCVVIPWWLDAVYGLRRPDARRRPFWVQGVIGALIFCLYYYFFFPLALSLLLLPLLRRWHRTRITTRYRDPLLVLLVTAALSAVYWLPLLVSLVRTRDPVSLQNLWFTPDYVELPVGIFDWTPTAMLMLAGLAHTVFTARRDRLSAELLLLIIAGYAWYVLGFLLTAAHKPVLVFRTEPFVELLMLIAAARAAAALLAWAGARLMRMRPPRVRDASMVAAALGLALAFVLGQGVITGTLNDPYVQQSRDTPLPNGALQPYANDDATAPRVSVDKLEHVVRAMDNSGTEEPVVLSDNDAMLKVSGMYSFNQWHAIYAHPAGEFRTRVHFLRRLAGTRNSDRFAAMARGNRFDPIDVVVLRRHDGGLHYDVKGVDFPNGDRDIDVTFHRAQFSPDHWQTRIVGPYFIAAAR